jgi:hypothetical protein
MPTPKRPKKHAAGTPGNPLPVIPQAVLEHFAPEGPMTAGARQATCRVNHAAERFVSVLC